MTAKPAERTAPVAAATPGPWKMERPFRASPYISMGIFANGEHIAEVMAQPDQIGPEPNARLIAAAPALRDALAGLLDVLIDGEWGTHGHALADRAARAALALAEGR
jgi:hypothetical protein